MLPELANSIDAGVVASRILDLFQGGFEVDGTTHAVYASIGVAIYPDDATNTDDLLHHADAAMYEAKRNGRYGLQFFTQKISDALNERKRIERGIKLALESNSMSLVFMPMFGCHTLEIMGIEVLVRSNHPSLEGIGPDKFIPVAETTGLIKELDLWVIDNSLSTIKELQNSHGFKGIICINTSGVELHNEGFPDQVRRLLEKHQVDPATIELEITETSLVLDDKKGVLILRQLRELGITLSLDDFGTGYTAFSQLINYPVDCLKIDKSFVGGLFTENENRHKIIRIIQNLAEI
jgi:EAL domain-containing protein (putative c-di-GMP-specific phosphodiesterase class I)